MRWGTAGLINAPATNQPRPSKAHPLFLFLLSGRKCQQRRGFVWNFLVLYLRDAWSCFGNQDTAFACNLSEDFTKGQCLHAHSQPTYYSCLFDYWLCHASWACAHVKNCSSTEHFMIKVYTVHDPVFQLICQGVIQVFWNWNMIFGIGQFTWFAHLNVVFSFFWLEYSL